MIRLTSNSLSNLSVIISRWSNPKNPHLKPKPRALEDSGSYEKLASFNLSLASPSFNFWYSELSTGNRPQNTTGLLGLKPGSGSLIGAGALISPGTNIPPNSLVVGRPGKIIRSTTSKEQNEIIERAQHYIDFSKKYI